MPENKKLHVVEFQKGGDTTSSRERQMSSDSSSRGLWVAIGALSAAVATGVGAYLTLGQGVVHSAELQAAIDRNSPYIRDKAAIDAALSKIEAEEGRETIAREKLYDEVVVLRIQLAKDEVKLQHLVRQHGG